jgi:type II secretory pathway component GspD/PulD (secretin)
MVGLVVAAFVTAVGAASGQAGRGDAIGEVSPLGELPELPELPELEFRDQPLRNVLMVIGDLAGLSVVADASVGGRVSQILQPMSVTEALDLLAAQHGALWWVEGSVVRVSRVRVTRSGEGDATLDVHAVEAPIAAVAAAAAGAPAGTRTRPLLFDRLPEDPVTLRLTRVRSEELARLLVRRYPRFSVEADEEAVYIRDTSRPDSDARRRDLEVTRDASPEVELYSARAHGISLAAVVERLFSVSGREYVLLADADRELRNVRFSRHPFDELLRRVLAAADASFETDGGTYYIRDAERRVLLSRLEQSVRVELSHVSVAGLERLLPAELSRTGVLRLDRRQGSVVVSGAREEVTAALRFISAVDRPADNRRYRRFDLTHAEVSAVLATLPERFAGLAAVRVPGANAFLARTGDTRAAELEHFLALVDRRDGSRVVTLRYIRAEDLLRHLPPEVAPEHIHTTPDPQVVMVSGSAQTQLALLDALEVVDKPVAQLRYQLLVVQYQEGRSVEWSPNAENARMTPGDSTVLLGRIGELLSLDFDIVTSLGYRFALELSHRVSEDEAHVLADTTLNGISGERVEFRNTNTFRYRDQEVDPDTGEAESLGVTREITSGLFVGVEGWSSGDGMITMDISATLSRRGTDVSADGTNPPPTSERVVDTQVRTRSGRPVVIGGLMQQDVSINRRKTPLLGSIPLLGTLFQSTTRSVEETELVLYLLPVVQPGGEVRYGVGQPTMGGAAAAGERAPVGERLHGYLDRLLEEEG